MNSVPFLPLRRVRIQSIVIFILFASIASVAYAQPSTGELRGKVTNADNGEPITRATIKLADTRLGGLTDLNGVYSIRNIPSGRYKVVVTYLGFATQEFADVEIGQGVARLDVVLQPTTIKGGPVKVVAERTGGTEGALLNERRKAATVNDGISAAQIRRLNDPTATEALTRVTGLTMGRSGYANVRVANERYSNTQLNGVTMVSTDPGKRAFSFDLVPANLLENTVVAKTFTPDLPGDFSGGLVQMSTIDFPDQRMVRLSVSGTYIDGTSFKTIELGPRGSNDFFGIDDGTRGLPEAFPDTGKLSSQHYEPEEIAEIARTLPNNYRIAPRNVGPNMSFVGSYGDRFDLLGSDLGVVAAISYRNSFDRTEIKRYDTTVGSVVKYDYTGVQNEYSTLWGGLLNMSYKIADLHTISVKNTYNHTTDDQLTTVQGVLNSDFENRPYVFQYLERSFYSGQVTGEHLFTDLGNLRLQWRGFGALGKRYEPDLRRVTYTRPAGDTSVPLQTPLSPSLVNAYGAGRIYTNLDEDLGGFGADLTLPIGTFRVKGGGLVENKARDVATRSFSYTLDYQAIALSQSALDTLFDPSHIGPDAIMIEETTSPSDRYGAQSHLKAGYLMTDLPFEVAGQRFRVILGARYEDSRVMVNTVDANSEPMTVDYTTKDWLPSASMIYEITPKINLRLAYSKTVARPDFREFARSVFYDFIADALTYGNPALKRTLVSNYDFRFEIFPEPGELMAVSVFHKTFRDAIEEIALPTGSTTLEKTWMNTDGINTGVELELRKSFGFVADVLDPFSFTINYTWLDSKVDLGNANDTNARQRKLQGQSPYIINAGLYYDNADLGTSVSIAYNRFGERISSVSASLIPDLIEQPRDRVDLTISQAFLQNFELKLSVRDLLAQDIVFTQFDRESRVDRKRTNVSLGVTAKL